MVRFVILINLFLDADPNREDGRNRFKHRELSRIHLPADCLPFVGVWIVKIDRGRNADW